jgi:hypothetical protein
MKTFLIAAGLMAAMFGGAPAAVAAPVSGYAPGIEAPQSRDDRRDDRRMDRRDDRRGDRWNNRDHRRGDRWDNRRDRRWGWNNRRCHNERRHGRWIRVCGRNWR